MPTSSPRSFPPPVRAGAEAFSLPGHGDLARVGALVCHGFTGNPSSVRPWGEHLARAGVTVVGPRLPGHGTTWQDMNTTTWQDWYAEAEQGLDDLRSRVDTVFVLGLSMGGTLTLRLLEERGAQIAGGVVVNASLATERKDAKLLPLLSRVLPSFPGIGSDIKKPGVTEDAYDRIPLRAAHSLSGLWSLTRADLGRISQPLLVLRSREDHVVEPVSGRVLREGTSSNASVEEVVLEDSYHVATLDNDAPLVFDRSLRFIRQHAGLLR